MDNKGRPQTWNWLPEQMPGVAKLMWDKRAAFGNEWVNQCWKRGVVQGEPDWLFAREGALAVGAPWTDPEFANFAAQHVTSTQAVLLIKAPEASNGAH